METLSHRVMSMLSSTGGAALAGVTRAGAALRPAAKPLHPHGRVVTGQLHREGLVPSTGVSWIDRPGDDEVLVRESRAIGLPEAVPDIHGLALRVPIATGHADLLFASTGLGHLSRFLLTASRSSYGRPMTTLLPYRTENGPLLIAALPKIHGSYELACATPTSSWRTFAYLTLPDTETDTDAPDPVMSFDPVENPLPGLVNYGWVRRLREPSYFVARRSRRNR